MVKPHTLTPPETEPFGTNQIGIEAIRAAQYDGGK